MPIPTRVPDDPPTDTIPSIRYRELLDAERKLSLLEAYGVDNWGGYIDAMKEFYADPDE